MSFPVVLVASVVAACSALAVGPPAVYDAPQAGPPKAGTEIDAIEKALNMVVNSPHLTKPQLDSAKKVAADVEKTVAELESPKGKLLSKEARAKKVTSSIKELQALQSEWQKATEKTISSRKEALMKELQQKEAELDKDKKMLKVMNLEKQLAEKKLSLQKLVDMKNEEAARQASQKEAAAQEEMVANLVKAAKSLQGNNTKAAALKGVQIYLEARIHNVSDAIAALDVDEKKHAAEVKTAVADVPTNGKTDAIDKGRSLLNSLLKKEHRKYQKAEAGLKSELHELQGAVASIKKGDVAGLSKVMSHMQGEMKALQAKTQKFLY